MEIELILVYNKENEEFYKIIDSKTKKQVGIIFSVLNHIAYEIYPEYRRNGLATKALKKLIRKIEHPLLEITFSNIASIKVAKKSGFVLKRVEGEFGIYEINRQTR